VKYVALLAFNRIVASHPHLVSQQQDVIMDCLDDPDISIRLQALDLVSGMVDSGNLQPVVSRLMKQLQSSPRASDEPPKYHGAIEPAADADGEDPEERLELAEKRSDQPPPLPNDYRTDVIRRIITICSKDTYTNIADFEWYLEILVQLVRVIPSSSGRDGLLQASESDANAERTNDVAFQIGSEIRNVAVRVKSVRAEATRAAESLILVNMREELFPQHGGGAEGVLEPVVWIVGEYAQDLAYPADTLNSLIHPTSLGLPQLTLAAYLQAIPKVFVLLSCDESISWEPSRKTTISLLLARIVHFLEKLSAHPSLEVQERAIEFLELLRLAGEAVASAEAPGEPPLFLTTALITLFSGMELNPVSSGAQKKVPRPTNIDLDVALNGKLSVLLQMSDADWLGEASQDESERFYSEREIVTKGKPIPAPQVEDLHEPSQSSSYQNLPEETDPALSARLKAQRRAARRERNKDDPFYIANPNDDLSSGQSTPFHDILKSSNGEELDVDAIPIMDLDLSGNNRSRDASPYISEAEPKKKKKPKPRKVEIAVDETLDFGDNNPTSEPLGTSPSHRLVQPTATNRAKKSLLQVDSSSLGSFSLESPGQGAEDAAHEIERREAEEKEMAEAMKEVEMLRLEMQRRSERIEAPDEEVVVKRKKKKPVSAPVAVAAEGSGLGAAGEAVEPEEVMEKAKKKKKKKKVKEADTEAVPKSGESILQ
jgi:AP-3 complex subunit delta